MADELRLVDCCDDCGTHEDVAEWPQIGGNFCHDCADERLDRLCVDCGASEEPRNADKRCPYCADNASWEAS